MPKWEDIELDAKVFQNIKETSLTRANAALENAFVNEAGGHTRFPGIKAFIDLPDGGIPYLWDWQGDLVAATTRGSVYRIGLDGTVDDATDVAISGGRRVVFDKTPNELLMAAGGRIIKLSTGKTEILAETAPQTSHVAYIANFVVALELKSQRFQHAPAGVPAGPWSALDTFSAEGTPDPLNALIRTPFDELLACGPDSIEQFEPFPNGERPFALRFPIGDGLRYPYSLVLADNATFGINKDDEIVRFSGQTTAPISGDIGAVIESLDDKSETWGVRLHVLGQKFILWQFPNATNPYGTKGVTVLYDYRTRKFYNLYGWDDERGTPDRWPGHSYHELEGRRFVGLEGAVGELDLEGQTNRGERQRMLYRSAHISDWGESDIDQVRMRLTRGVVDSNAPDPVIRMRWLKDNRRHTNWVERTLGKAGDRDMILEWGTFGSAHTWQMEYEISDDSPVEIVAVQALVERHPT